MVQVLFITFRICLSSSTGFSVVSIFLAFEAPQESWDVLLNSLETIAYLHLLGSTGLIKCQDVSVGLDSFYAFSSGDSSYICNSLFSQSWCNLLLCSQCQFLLLITPLDYGVSHASRLCILSYERFLSLMFSVCLWVYPSASKLPFLVFLTVFGLAIVEITFSMRKGENLIRQTSSKDSITMNLGKSTASFSESDSVRFLLDFLFEDVIYAEYFSLALLSTIYHEVQLVLGMNQRGNPFALVETVICNHYIRVEGRFPSRCQSQVQLTFSHRLLAPNRDGYLPQEPI